MSNVDFVIAEISDYNENVCFEMGQCVALEIFCYRIKNTLHNVDVPVESINLMLNSLKYKPYQFNLAVKTSNEPNKVDWQSAEKVVKKIAEEFRKIPQDKRKATNPFDNTRRLSMIPRPEKPAVFIFAEKSEQMYRWIKDYTRMIRDELGILVRDDPGPAYEGPEAMKYLESIARSTHCIIDITSKNRFSAFLLGYAVSRETKNLAVWRRGTDSLITNYRGEAGHQEYETKDELWHAICGFIQTAP